MLMTGEFAPSAPMKVYAHQGTQGRKLLINFDELVKATSELDKCKDVISGKRKYSHSRNGESADVHSSKAPRPLRIYPQWRSRPEQSQDKGSDDEE